MLALALIFLLCGCAGVQQQPVPAYSYEELQSTLMQGKTKPEVTAMLGKPDLEIADSMIWVYRYVLMIEGEQYGGSILFKKDGRSNGILKISTSDYDRKFRHLQ